MNASELRAAGRNALKGHWGTAILVTFVAVILGGSIGVGNNLLSSSVTNTAESSYSSSSSDGYSLIGQDAIFASSTVVGSILSVVLSVLALVLVVYFLVTLFIGGAITLGLNLFNVRLVTHQYQKPFSTLFERFDIVFKALLLQLAMGLFIFLWALLLIIPGIVAAYRYALAPYLMAENPHLGVMEAISQSKQMMMGHKGRLFFLELSFIGWAFLCIFTLGIGLLWLFPYIGASEAAFYRERVQQVT